MAEKPIEASAESHEVARSAGSHPLRPQHEKQLTPSPLLPPLVPALRTFDNLKSLLAWQVTAYLGLTVLVFYVAVAWPPAILTKLGYSAAPNFARPSELIRKMQKPYQLAN